MTWISVKERLPQDSRSVLVCGPHPNKEKRLITTAFYDFVDGEWSRPSMAISHWMPLPEVPEEEEPWPRPECDGCDWFKCLCTEGVPLLDETGICKETTAQARMLDGIEDQPTVADLRIWAEQLGELAGCPPDVPLGNWVKTLYASLGEANDMRTELDLLREFVQAVADENMEHFATKRGFSKMKSLSTNFLGYYIAVAGEVLARKIKP